MSHDHCIITKYTLSEREKEFKRAFFSKKSQNHTASINKTALQENKTEKYKFNLNENDEMINKLIDENLQELKLYETRNKISNSNKISLEHYQNQTSINPLNHLNLVYSQNKILERNVDVLHETQRSLHDLLVYNIHKDKQDFSKNFSKNDKERIYLELIAPLITKFDELKNSLNHIQTQMGTKSTNSTINHKEKLQEFEMTHNKFKENSHKFEKSVELIEKNKLLNKDNQILKAIEELKNSVGQINKEMNKMETEFSLNIKRIVEENKFKNLMNGINSSVNSVNETVNKLSSISNAKNSNNTKHNPNSLDYVDYHNELLDINLRKEELLNDYKSKKFDITNFTKIVTPKEKIEFSYKLDFEDENNHANYNSDKSTKMTHSRSYISNRDSDIEKSGKNIFLNNLSHSVKSAQNNLDNYQPGNIKIVNKIMSSRINTKQEQTMHLANKTKSKSKEKSNNNRMQIHNQSEHNIYIKENYECIPSENFNPNTHIESLPENDMNILERMKECKEKMKNYKSNINSEIIDSIPTSSVNVNYSTKNNTSHDSSEPSTAKYLKSSSVLKNIGQKLEQIKETEIDSNPIANEDVFSLKLKQIEYDLNNKMKNEPLTKRITAVDATTQDKKKSDAVHDIVMKLCVEKILIEKNKYNCEKENLSYVDKLKCDIVNNLTYDSDNIEFKKIVEDVLTENVKNIIRTKRKNYPAKIDVKENDMNNSIISPNMIHKLREENDKRENEIQNYLKDIISRFEKIEKTINLQKKENIDNLVMKEDMNLDEMVNKITDKIKSNMHISIHLSNLDEKKKESQTNLLQTYNHSLQIEAVKKPLENIHDKSLNNDLSTYSHPFANDKRVHLEKLERDIPLPYLIDLNQYEVSSATDIEISQSNRTNQTDRIKNQSNLVQIIPNHYESESEGQLNDSKTDQDTSRYITDMTNNTNQVDIYGEIHNIKVIQNLNEKISMMNSKGNFNKLEKSKAASIHDNEHNINTFCKRGPYKKESLKDLDHDEYEEEEDENYSHASSLEINKINRHVVNINDNEELKRYNLFNSEEFNIFQKTFNDEKIMRESRNFNLMTSTKSDKGFGFNSLNHNSLRMIKFTNNSVDVEKENNNNTKDNPNNILYHYNTLNPNVLSFGNFISNKSSQQSNNLNSNSAKLIKISNEEIEDLIKRQNDVNNKLKIIARSVNDNNTITENNSELTTLKQMADSVISQSDRKYSNEGYNYKTDESSFVQSYRNY